MRCKLRLVRQFKAPEPIRTFSTDEEARFIGLADLVLNNESTRDRPLAGEHAQREHEFLKRTLRETVERLLEDQNRIA
jgi:hypothetical protein